MKTSTSFKKYLQGNQYSNASIATYERFTNQFLEWVQKENLETGQLRYQDVLAYMKYCSTKKSYSQKSVQHTVITLSHYFDYLLEAGKVDHNPAKGIKVQGVKRKTLYHILESQELHRLYNDYEAITLSEKRNKVILGLLVYQGLKSEDLFRLEMSDIKLREGKVEVHGSKRTNGRTLQLDAHQVLDVYEYVMKVRPEIMELSNESTDQLFVGVEGGRSQSHFVQDTLKPLRKTNPKLKNPDQLRASVIVKWLKQYNLREVQYLAGHRYISSTEAYQQSEMQGLSEEINKFHPLG